MVSMPAINRPLQLTLWWLDRAGLLMPPWSRRLLSEPPGGLPDIESTVPYAKGRNRCGLECMNYSMKIEGQKISPNGASLSLGMLVLRVVDSVV